MKKRICLIFGGLLLAGAAPLANTPLDDPSREAAALALMQEVRCLVCQYQSIADSNAEMAADMRALVREQIGAGQSRAEVKSYLVSRYGDWVTFDPPKRGSHLLLWAAPAIFAGLGLFAFWRMFRGRVT